MDEEKTVMDRVANVWLTFSVLSAAIGAAAFLGLSYGLAFNAWVAISVAVIVGILSGAALSKLRPARQLVGIVLAALTALPWIS